MKKGVIDALCSIPDRNNPFDSNDAFGPQDLVEIAILERDAAMEQAVESMIEMKKSFQQMEQLKEELIEQKNRNENYALSLAQSEKLIRAVVHRLGFPKVEDEVDLQFKIKQLAIECHKSWLTLINTESDELAHENQEEFIEAKHNQELENAYKTIIELNQTKLKMEQDLEKECQHRAHLYEKMTHKKDQDHAHELDACQERWKCRLVKLQSKVDQLVQEVSISREKYQVLEKEKQQSDAQLLDAQHCLQVMKDQHVAESKKTVSVDTTMSTQLQKLTTQNTRMEIMMGEIKAQLEAQNGDSTGALHALQNQIKKLELLKPALDIHGRSKTKDYLVTPSDITILAKENIALKTQLQMHVQQWTQQRCLQGNF